MSSGVEELDSHRFVSDEVGGDVDEEEGRGVVSVGPMSRVRWEGQQQQDLVQRGVEKDVQYNHLRDDRDGDAFQANNCVQGACWVRVRAHTELVVFEYGECGV